jgi:general secretion pathway protein B
MSYILDALKRADAERERGHVPGLHAQPLGSPAPQPAAAPAVPRWAWAVGGLVGMGLVAALAWRLGADAAAPVPATVALPSPEPAAATTPAAAAPAAPSPDPSPRPVAIAPAPRPPVAASPEPVALAPVAPPPRAAAPSAPAVAASAAPSNAPIPLYAQLPPGLRQQLPGLAVTGSVYSDDVASRFIMLNGEVAKEGSQPQPGLVVERIEPRSAVLRYKGERFRLPY